MNYRHQYHAGNFADVMKHVLLVELVRALQRKPKGFLYLDTHAGRGAYDLTLAGRGDSLERRPEWPEGVGRLFAAGPDAVVADAESSTGPIAGSRERDPSGLAGGEADIAGLSEYLRLVRGFDVEQGGGGGAVPRYYPGSPWLVRMLARVQDRLALCEQHPEEQASLARELGAAPRTRVHAMDGYVAVRAMLPAPERRALVLIDPPYEAADEFVRITTALDEGLARLASAVFAVWYPLTERARVDAFFAALGRVALPPTLVLELAVAGDDSPLKLRGCGLVVVNPPWGFEATARTLLTALGRILAQGPGAGARVTWMVPDE